MYAQARTLVSGGAYEFASSSGINTVRPDVMVSPRTRKEWKLWSERVNNNATNDNEQILPGGSNRTLMQDTVGAVALDTFGNLASGVSRSVN